MTVYWMMNSFNCNYLSPKLFRTSVEAQDVTKALSSAFLHFDPRGMSYNHKASSFFPQDSGLAQ